MKERVRARMQRAKKLARRHGAGYCGRVNKINNKRFTGPVSVVVDDNN